VAFVFYSDGVLKRWFVDPSLGYKKICMGNFTGMFTTYGYMIDSRPTMPHQNDLHVCLLIGLHKSTLSRIAQADYYRYVGQFIQVPTDILMTIINACDEGKLTDNDRMQISVALYHTFSTCSVLDAPMLDALVA
jgi:hypothetical protein